MNAKISAAITMIFAGMIGWSSCWAASPAEIQAWLNSHNQARRLHQVGDVVWSNTVAASAQAYANTCPSGHSGTKYGENLAWASYTVTPEKVVGWWYSEEADYNYNDPGFTSGTGHFTQIVWKGTTEIGCGFKSGCGGGMPNVWVCQYNPPGNWLGRFAENVFPPKGNPEPEQPAPNPVPAPCPGQPEPEPVPSPAPLPVPLNPPASHNTILTPIYQLLLQ